MTIQPALLKTAMHSALVSDAVGAFGKDYKRVREYSNTIQVLFLFFGVIMYLCGIRNLYLFLPLVYLCLPLGLNLVVYPESCGYEKEAGDNAKLCFISYVLALVVLPCIFALLTKLCM